MKVYTQPIMFHGSLVYLTAGDRFVSNNSACPRFEISDIFNLCIFVNRNGTYDRAYYPINFAKELELYESFGGTYTHCSSRLSRQISKLAKSMDRYKNNAHR